MSDERGPSGASVVLAFLAGAIAGAAVALLAAPRSGRETRDRLRAWGQSRTGPVIEAATRAARAARRAFDESVGAPPGTPEA